jgi:hypothetical protein
VPVTSLVGLYMALRVLREVAGDSRLEGRGAGLAAVALSATTLASWVVGAVVILILGGRG